MRWHPRTIAIGVVTAAVALVAVACGDSVASNPKLALARALDDLQSAEASTVTISLVAPDLALENWDLDDEAAVRFGERLEDLALEVRTSGHDPDLSPSEQLRGIQVETSFLFDGAAVLRYRIVDGRTFASLDADALSEAITAIAAPEEDPAAMAEALVDEARLFMGDDVADQLASAGWLELVDLVIEDVLEDLQEPALEEGFDETLSAFARDRIDVAHVSSDPDRLRVSTTLGAIMDLALDLEALDWDLGIDSALEDEFADMPEVLREAELWLYVELEDDRLRAMELPVGRVLEHLAETAAADGADPAERADAREAADELREMGLHTMSVRVAFDVGSEPVTVPDDAVAVGLETVLEELFAWGGMPDGTVDPAMGEQAILVAHDLVHYVAEVAHHEGLDPFSPEVWEELDATMTVDLEIVLDGAWVHAVEVRAVDGSVACVHLHLGGVVDAGSCETERTSLRAGPAGGA